MPRFRIGWLMVLVAVAALDFAAIKALLDDHDEAIDWLVCGALPVANILLAVFFAGRQGLVNRSFLSGFLILGTAALAFYIAEILLHGSV